MTIYPFIKFIPGFTAIILLSVLTLKFSLKKRVLFKRKPYLYIIPLLITFFLIASTYLISRSVLAEFFFMKSLASESAKEVYDYQRLAIITNPYIADYRIKFSQTNLLIAANIASQVQAEAAEGSDVTPGGRNASANKLQVSTSERQTITQAIKAALEEAKAAISLDDKKASHWENLALVYRSLIGTAQDADVWTISSYQRAILLDPQNPRYRLDLGGVYYQLEEYDEANRFFEEAVTLKPDWANAHYNLAWTLYQKIDYKRAVSEMQTVIKLLDPTKEAADLAKAQKDLEEFKLKQSEENTP